MTDETMTIAEAASYLSVSEITVKRYIREKLIQSDETDGQIVLSKAAVENYKKINEQFARR